MRDVLFSSGQLLLPVHNGLSLLIDFAPLISNVLLVLFDLFFSKGNNLDLFLQLLLNHSLLFFYLEDDLFEMLVL